MAMIGYIVLVLLTLWIGWITFAYRRLQKNYLTLMQSGNKKTLDSILSELLHDQQRTKEDIAKLVSRCDRIEKDEGYHIQKIGLLRFNPFKDTGGDQSFILALVDAHDTGVIITALYSRSGTRWYSKRVIKGQGAEHQLSDEEKKTLHMAAELK